MANKKILISWLYDSNECETCGGGYAEGARVMLDDELIIEHIPVAGCVACNNWDSTQIYTEIFEKLGYELITEYGDV